jgi:hypothetical protein
MSDTVLLEVIRFSGQADDTLGLFMVNGVFQCFTLEDEQRTVKVFAETRIPAGTYRVELKKWGGFHKRYSVRFKSFHLGMLWVRDVPNFEHILIHVGNRDDDTAGCILLGDTCQQNVTESGFIGSSVAAYRRVYPPIARHLEDGGRVELIVRDGLT